MCNIAKVAIPFKFVNNSIFLATFHIFNAKRKQLCCSGEKKYSLLEVEIEQKESGCS